MFRSWQPETVDGAQCGSEREHSRTPPIEADSHAIIPHSETFPVSQTTVQEKTQHHSRVASLQPPTYYSRTPHLTSPHPLQPRLPELLGTFTQSGQPEFTCDSNPVGQLALLNPKAQALLNGDDAPLEDFENLPDDVLEIDFSEHPAPELQPSVPHITGNENFYPELVHDVLQQPRRHSANDQTLYPEDLLDVPQRPSQYNSYNQPLQPQYLSEGLGQLVQFATNGQNAYSPLPTNTTQPVLQSLVTNPNFNPGYPKENQNPCPYASTFSCFAIFTSINDAVRHGQLHTGKGYPCPNAASHNCTTTFTISWHAIRHAKKHFGEIFHCPVCRKGYSRRDNMNLHQRIRHGRGLISHNVSTSSTPYERQNSESIDQTQAQVDFQQVFGSATYSDQQDFLTAPVHESSSTPLKTLLEPAGIPAKPLARTGSTATPSIVGSNASKTSNGHSSTQPTVQEAKSQLAVTIEDHLRRNDDFYRVYPEFEQPCIYLCEAPEYAECVEELNPGLKATVEELKESDDYKTCRLSAILKDDVLQPLAIIETSSSAESTWTQDRDLYHRKLESRGYAGIMTLFYNPRKCGPVKYHVYKPEKLEHHWCQYWDVGNEIKHWLNQNLAGAWTHQSMRLRRSGTQQPPPRLLVGMRAGTILDFDWAETQILKVLNPSSTDRRWGRPAILVDFACLDGEQDWDSVEVIESTH